MVGRLAYADLAQIGEVILRIDELRARIASATVRVVADTTVDTTRG